MIMPSIAYSSIRSYKGYVRCLKKAKVIYFIYMQPRKMKFKFVQIDMKKVSYNVSPPLKGFFFNLYAHLSVRGHIFVPLREVRYDHENL